MTIEAYNRFLLAFERAFGAAKPPTWNEVRRFDDTELIGAIRAVHLHALSKFQSDKATLVLRFVQRLKTRLRPRRKGRAFA